MLVIPEIQSNHNLPCFLNNYLKTKVNNWCYNIGWFSFLFTDRWIASTASPGLLVRTSTDTLTVDAMRLVMKASLDGGLYKIAKPAKIFGNSVKLLPKMFLSLLNQPSSCGSEVTRKTCRVTM